MDPQLRRAAHLQVQVTCIELHHCFEELSYFHIAWSYCAMK